MKKEKCFKRLFFGIAMLALFVLFTALVCTVDTEPIGPRGSMVGFAKLNSRFHRLTGVNMPLYTVTDWLGIIPFCFVLGFAVLGACQLVKRKSFIKVDSDILLLGGFYIVVMAAYLFFERFVVNCRPVLIKGVLEASYPSSTTMLAMCVMPTAIMQFHRRIKCKTLRAVLIALMSALTAFMVTARLLSGVHWLTDIVGGAIFSIAVVTVYGSLANLCDIKKDLSN